jgi:kanamycin kinase/aminoglycoside 3'-phosphotransferase-3
MMNLPDKIKKMIHGGEYHVDEVGMSDSTILMFDHMILKIQSTSAESQQEYQVMKWLDGKLPVPKVIEFEEDSTDSYLLMTRLSGQMACAEEHLSDPDALTSLLAEGLRKLWSIDIHDCPFSFSLDERLQTACFNVENDLVDLEAADPDTFGPNGFKDPGHLLQWLKENRPEVEPAFSHGDYCLENIMIADGEISGFIDLGKSGIADKWQDIALCYRSLQYEFDEKFSSRTHSDYHPDSLFEKLNIESDWEKIRYYMLLDELF